MSESAANFCADCSAKRTAIRGSFVSTKHSAQLPAVSSALESTVRAALDAALLSADPRSKYPTDCATEYTTEQQALGTAV